MKLTSTLLLGLFFISAVYTLNLEYVGVNMAGAEFGSVGQDYGVGYIYPKPEEIDYFVSKGLNAFRVCFKWERLQNTANQSFVPEELTRLQTLVNYITEEKGKYAILDPHNYGKYYDGPADKGAFGDFWKRLAEIFKDNNNVLFNLINEPTTHEEQWYPAAQHAINVCTF